MKEKEIILNKTSKTGLTVSAISALGSLFGLGYWFAYKKGRRAGARNREKEILIDYTSYIPLGEIGNFARELMDEGVSEDFPMLVIRSDKYDYLDETDPKPEK